MRVTKRRILVTSASVLLLLIGVGGFALRALLSGMYPSVVTDIGAYSEGITEWAPLAGHFPRSVPPQAANVRFSALPKYLQGGGHLQLHVQLAASQIGPLEAAVKAKAIRAYVGGDIFTHVNQDRKNGVPTANYRTSGNAATRGFPNQFTLYVLRATDFGIWDHGETTGIAISPTTSEVVYWAESW